LRGKGEQEKKRGESADLVRKYQAKVEVGGAIEGGKRKFFPISKQARR